ncbi:MAG: hypothetical protein U0929_04185 [Planctomycetaceae bacterium]
MQRNALLGFGLLATVGVAFAAGDPKSSPASAEPQDALMRAKLASTQAVVEGLVEKDFAMINKAGVELLKMCNSGEWEANQDATYADYREQLRRQSRKLIDQAGTRNLEGATYAYMGVLSTCVDCHSHCRDVLKIASDMPQLRAVPIPTTVSSNDEAVAR